MADQRVMRDFDRTDGVLPSGFEFHFLEPGPDREDRIMKQTLLDHLMDLGSGVQTARPDLTFQHRDQQVSQPADMVEVRVRQKQVQVRDLQATGHLEQARPRIKGDTDIRQQHTSCVPPLIRVKAAGAKELDPHGSSIGTQSTTSVYGTPGSGIDVTPEYSDEFCYEAFGSTRTGAGRRRTNSIANAPAAAASSIHSFDSEAGLARSSVSTASGSSAISTSESATGS